MLVASGNLPVALFKDGVAVVKVRVLLADDHKVVRQGLLRLEQVDGSVALEVRDDGSGFDPSGSFPGHLGLRSMRERAVRLGGTLEIESAPGAGTLVLTRIPL